MKKILVIGGNQGLGKEIVTKLSTSNNVVTLSRKSEVPLDLSWPEDQIQKAVKTALDQLGGLDSLVVSSGLGAYYWPLVKQDKVEEVMKINFIGPTTVFKTCLKALLKSKGNAMFVTSTVARKPGAGGLSYYAASKGAMHSWITSEARRVSKKGLSVFALSPGWISTGMTSNIKEPIQKGNVNAIPFGRYGSAEEIANFAVNLLFESNWVTSGSIYECSGGM